MIYLQTIFSETVNRIISGSSVSDVTLVTDNNWTFTTDELKNISIDLDIIIGDYRYTVTAILGKLISIYGLAEPIANSWTLALSFRFGHTIEINNILSEAAQMDTESIKRFPFVWLMLNNENKPLPNFGINAYETECKIAFVNVAQINAQAAERLANNFEKILDKIFVLFFSELNKLPIAGNFNIKTSEPIRPTFVNRVFYGSADKKLNVFPEAQTDAIECKFDLQVVPESLCNFTGLNPELVPILTLSDNGTDTEAFTNELFTIRKTLTNLTQDIRPIEYTLIFDYGILGTETFTGILQFGENVNITSSKILTNIVAPFVVLITGAVVDSVNVNLIQIATLITNITTGQTISIFTAFENANDFYIDFGDGHGFEICNNGYNQKAYTTAAPHEIKLKSNTNNWNNLTTLISEGGDFSYVNLTYYNRTSAYDGSIVLSNSNILRENIILPSATKLNELNFGNNAIIEGIIDLSSIQFGNNAFIDFPRSHMLNGVVINKSIQHNIKFINFFETNMNQENVDNILDIAANYNSNTLNGTMQLDGTYLTFANAAPSAAGIANKNILISRGWTVTNN